MPQRAGASAEPWRWTPRLEVLSPGVRPHRKNRGQTMPSAVQMRSSATRARGCTGWSRSTRGMTYSSHAELYPHAVRQPGAQRRGGSPTSAARRELESRTAGGSQHLELGGRTGAAELELKRPGRSPDDVLSERRRARPNRDERRSRERQQPAPLPQRPGRAGDRLPSHEGGTTDELHPQPGWWPQTGTQTPRAAADRFELGCARGPRRARGPGRRALPFGGRGTPSSRSGR